MQGRVASWVLGAVRDELTATLRYVGTPTDVSDFEPLFGTDGVAIPEGRTAALLSLGLRPAGVAPARARDLIALRSQ